MTRPIAIFGAGGHGREVLQIIHDLNRSAGILWQPLGFVVDAEYQATQAVHGLPVLGDLEWLRRHPEVEIVVAIGSSAARWRVTKRIRSLTDNRFATLVHPTAWVGENVDVGVGSIVCAGASLSTDIRIGEHVHVNIGSTVCHDAVLSDFVSLNPRVNLSGNVTLGEGVEVGTGSVLIPHTQIGAWSIVGAGTVVTRSLAANVTAVGSPARVVKERFEGWQEN